MTLGLTDEYLKLYPMIGWRKKCKYMLRFLSFMFTFCCGFHKIKINGIQATKSEVNKRNLKFKIFRYLFKIIYIYIYFNLTYNYL
jgi:hypothetical protein